MNKHTQATLIAAEWTKRAALAASVVFLLASGRAGAGSAPAPGGIRVAGSLELDGDSTLHKYSAKTHEFSAVFGLDEGTTSGLAARDVEALIRGRHLKAFDLAIPVDKLTSGESGLDRNMRKALKSDQFKDIQFHMASYEVRAPAAAGAALVVALRGRVRVAGIDKTVDVIANAFRMPDGLRIAGSTDLLMTDFQVKPPVLMMGMIKTANLITVKFDVELHTPAS